MERELGGGGGGRWDLVQEGAQCGGRHRLEIVLPQTMYYTDSMRGTLDKLDFDLATGAA